MAEITKPTALASIYQNDDYDDQKDQWEIMDDLYQGADRVKEKTTKYLPATELELQEMRTSVGANSLTKTRYAQRLDRAVFINGIDRLTKFAMGHLFRESVKIPEAFSSKNDKLMKDADLLGTDLRQFIRNVSTRAYVLGHQFVVVDMPRRAPGSLQEQKNGNFRPYLVALDPMDLVDWSISTAEDGTPQLDWAIILRTEYEERTPFAARRPKNVYIVWYKDRWERYEVIDPSNANSETRPTLMEEGVNPIGEVPIYAIYSNLVRPMVSRPPLMEAAYINISHYQTYSMSNHGLMYHLNPLLVFIGLHEDGDVKLNASTAAYLPRESEAKYVEYQGSGLKIAFEAAKALADEMMEAGLRSTTFLGANTSAEARRVAKSDFNAFLISVANSYEHGWTKILQAVGKWQDVQYTDDEAKPVFNKDFDVTIMDAGLARFYLESLQAGAISQKTFLKSMVRGDVFNKELDVDNEIIESGKDAPRFVPAKARGGSSNVNPPANPASDTGPESPPQGQ